MFCLNEKVVYPGHGVAKINRLIKKNIAGQESLFYELVFVNKDVTVLVPTENAESVGIRTLYSSQEIDDCIKALSNSVSRSMNCEFTGSNWNKRNKDYESKLRSGNLKDLLEIYRELRFIATQKELSFGEKSLLTRTESLLVEEISDVQRMATEQTIEQLRSLCSANFSKPANIENIL